MPTSPVIDIRFYAPNGNRRSVKAVTVSAATWRFVRFGGYGDASFTIDGLTSSLSQTGGNQPVQVNDRVRVFVGNTLRYSGVITNIGRTEEDPPKLAITAQGIFSQVSSVPVDGRFINSVPVDISYAFASFANVEAKNAYPQLFTDIASSSLGVTTQVEDAFNKDLGAAFSQFTDRLSSVAVYGCDEYEAGSRAGYWVDRLFLRPIGNLTTPDYTVPVPGVFRGAAVTLASGGPDVSRLVNLLRVTGTDPLYPNLLGAGCNGNCGFERPILNGAAVSNTLFDSSFELITAFSPWTFGGGAASKEANLTEGAPRSGRRMVELDDAGETITHPLITGSFTAGQVFPFGVFARRERGDGPVTIKLKAVYRNSGVTVVTHERSFDLPDTIWRECTLLAVVPSGTVNELLVSVEFVSKSGATGAVIDDAFLYRSSVLQDGWAMTENGGASSSEDWAHSGTIRQGRYSVALQVTASDTDGQDAYLSHNTRFPITGNQSLRFTCFAKAFSGTSSGKLRLDFRWYDQNGTEISPASLNDVMAGTVTDAAWVQLVATATAPGSAVSCNVRLVFRGNSNIYVDQMQVRDQSAPMVGGVWEWIEAGPYQASFSTSDSNFSSYPFASSIPTYGKRYEQIQSDSVYDYQTALAVATRYFYFYAAPLAKPRLTLENNLLTAFKPGETIRLAGADGQWLGGTPTTGQPSRAYPIAEVEETVDDAGKITTTLSLEVEPPTLTRLIRELFTEQRLATTGGGSFSSSPVGGGAIPSGVSLPLSLADGGFGASNANVAAARTTLGLGSGLSVTIPLAKLTPAGADGSITTVNGIVTARTDPS